MLGTRHLPEIALRGNEGVWAGGGAGEARTRSPNALRMKSHLAEKSREGNLKKRRWWTPWDPEEGHKKGR